MRMVRCSNCQYEYQEDVEKMHDEGDSVVIRGRGKPPKVSSKTKKCVDLVCPNCKKEFEFCWEE
jgi:hypothetical protein